MKTMGFLFLLSVHCIVLTQPRRALSPQSAPCEL
jgi:hypothetical protein